MQHLDEGTIHAWLDGQLPPDEAQAVEAHVAECRPCADAVAEARGLIAASSRILTALDGVPRDVLPKQPVPTDEPDVVTSAPVPITVETPNDVIDVRSRVAASSPAVQRARRRWLTGPSLAAAATILVAVGTLTIMRSRDADTGLALEAGKPISAALSADSAASAAPTASVPAAPPAPSLGRSGEQANERQLAASAIEDRVATASARSERDQESNRTVPSGARSLNAAGAGAVANAPAPRDEAAKRALESESKQVVDEPARLAKARESLADSVVRRQAFSAVPAAPPPAAEARAKLDTQTVTIIRGREVSQQKIGDSARDARADVARAPTVQAQGAQAPRVQAQSAPAPTAQAPGAPTLAATGLVRGRVRDGNGAGVANAQITVGNSIGALTNPQGEFMLAGVPQGAQRVQVRRIGFELDTQTVTVVAGQTATADFVVRPVATNLESVVVTGTAAGRERRALGSSIARAPATADSAPAVSAAESNAVGCYEITVTPNAQQARNALRNVPRRLALDNEIVPANQDGVWYRVRDLERFGAVPNGVWRPVGTDGVELEWTYGSRLARIRLTGRAQTTMRGFVDEFDRSAGTAQSGTVVSIRRSCGG